MDSDGTDEALRAILDEQGWSMRTRARARTW